MNAEFRKNLKNYCLHLLYEKKAALKAEFDSQSESSAGDTKSSAGDKHETARAMMHLEQEKTGKQLTELELQITALEKLDINSATGKICKGCLVQTDKGLFFIAAPFGKIVFNNREIYVLSELSPLGKILLNSKTGGCVSLNGISYQIVSVN